MAGPECPVLVVQTRCETFKDEWKHPPVGDATLDGFTFSKVLHYSAKNDRGRAILEEPSPADAARQVADLVHAG